MFLITDFINLKIKSIQSFKGAYKDKIYIYIFIGVNTHIYISIFILYLSLNRVGTCNMLLRTFETEM
jgi:hypothetical protein